MGTTPDRSPGPSDEEEIVLRDRTVDGDPVDDGAIRFRSNDIVAKIPSGVVSLTQQGGSEAAHEAYDTLTHNIAETHYEERTRVNNRITNITIYTDATKTTKIRELTNIVRVNNKISTYDIIQYDASGLVKNTISYSTTRDSNGRFINGTGVKT